MASTSSRLFLLSRLALAVAGSGLGLGLAGMPQAASAESRALTRYDIPAGPLDEVLLSISQQSGQIISFDAALLEGHVAGPIRGALGNDEAIANALRGSGLGFSRTASGAVRIVVERSGGQALNDAEAPRLQTVIALGTRRHDVTALESLAPVELITPRQIEQTGAVTLNQALTQLVPSFNFPQGQNASKGTSAVRSASLRGLSPAYTLVLVNGKRRNPVGKLSGVDPWGADQLVEINNIPISAIERVEVLRDGASAQYGSDAIAGVLNIVLKERDAGGQVSTRLGEYKEGDGLTKTANGWWGTRLPGDGFLTLSLDGLNNKPVDRSGADLQYLNAGPAGDLRSGRWGQGGREQGAFLANAEVGVSDALRAYGTLNYGYSENYNDVNPNYSTSRDNILALYPNGFQPRVSEKRYDISVVGGVKYQDERLGDFDLAASYGENTVKGYLENSLSPSYGLASKRSFYRGESISESANLTLDWSRELGFGWTPSPWVVSGGLAYRHEAFEITEAGEEQSWNFGGGNIPAGQIGAGTPARFGAVDIAGINPADLGRISRDVYGLYLDLEGNLSERLEVGVALRAEDYSDFGETVNGKLSARYALTPALALRGTVSSGYRAPSLAQLGTQTTSYTGTWSFDGGQAAPGQSRLFRPDDPAVAAFGGKELDPVKARSLSLGLVWRPIEEASLTLDAYRIEIDGNILSTSTLQDPADGSSTNVRDLLAQAGLNNFTGASFYVNGYDTVTKGIDALGRYQLHLQQYGELELGAGLSLIDTQVSNVKQGSVLTRTGTTLFTRDVILNPENGTPDNKLTLSANWRIGAWTANLIANRYGEYTYNNPGSAERDQDFSAQWVVDLDLNYRFNPQLSVSLGANNLFDSYPEKYQWYNQTNGINRYGFIHPAGASGAFYYAGLTYSF